MSREPKKQIRQVYIAGAHSRAQTLRVYLEYLYSDIKVVAYLVDDMSENQEMIDGIPVYLIEEGLNIGNPVYIGTRGVYHDKMDRELKKVGFSQIIPVTVELDRQLRNKYMSRFFESNHRKFELIDDLEAIDGGEEEIKSRIYVASSIMDQPLKEQYSLIQEEVVLQVGAALTDKRLFGKVLTDFTGENISEKNRQYCELTGLYWIWKHAKEQYIGLVHYRRHFLLPENWKRIVKQNRIDVILPVPLYVAPSVEENFKSRHLPEDWEFLLEYMKTTNEGEYKMAKKVFGANLYYPCNMFIMKKEILHEFCSWLFPILDAVVEHGGIKEDTYMNRYPGFISERLLTLFFEINKNKYNIVYANKNFLN